MKTLTIPIGLFFLFGAMGCGNGLVAKSPINTIQVQPCPNYTRGNPSEVCLMWDASPSSAVTGYNMYVGYGPRLYSTHWDVGNVTSTVVRNLQPGQTYFFAVTAFDGNDNESDFSNEVTKDIPVIPNVLPGQ